MNMGEVGFPHFDSPLPVVTLLGIGSPGPSARADG